MYNLLRRKFNINLDNFVREGFKVKRKIKCLHLGLEFLCISGQIKLKKKKLKKC